jgi:hypothetical protein
MASIVARYLVATLLACAGLATLPAAAFSAVPYPFGWSASAIGDPETIFDKWDETAQNGTGALDEGCNIDDDPDQPARAFRFRDPDPTSDDTVQLNFGAGRQNRRMLGATLETAKRESTLRRDTGLTIYDPCQGGQDIVLLATDDPLDETFNNNEWLSSPYFENGTIYTLIHNEYHGWKWCNNNTDSDGDGFVNDGCPQKGPAAETLCSDAVDNDGDNSVNDGCPAVGAAEKPPCSKLLAEVLTNCWSASVTLASSTGAGHDLGRNYVQPTAPSHLIATIPHRYYEDWGYNGATDPSNIIYTRRPGDSAAHHYAMVPILVSGYLPNAIDPQLGTPNHPTPQFPGICVMRTDQLGDPGSWLGWGFRSDSPQLRFQNSFINPYVLTTEPAEKHTCQPTGGVGARSLTYNTYLKKYMLLSSYGGSAPPDPGTYYQLSDDLINWSQPQLLMKSQAVPTDQGGCTEPEPISYPSFLDPDDPARTSEPAINPNGWRNFDHPGRTPYVYFTQGKRDPSSTCKIRQITAGGTTRSDIDLARLRIDLRNQRQADLENGVVQHSSSGYDSFQGTFEAQPGSTVAGSTYEGIWRAEATWEPGQPSPHGTVNVNWPEETDVWYGSAFHGGDTTSALDRAGILLWDNAPDGQAYGGIVLGSDDKYRLVRGTTGGSETQLGPSFSVPQNRWFWLEVHQRLSTDSTKALSEVFLDGRLIASSQDQNSTAGSGAPISHVKFGLINAVGSSTYMWVDRSSILAAQRGPLSTNVGGHTFFQPVTPIGLKASPVTQSGIVTLWWTPPENPVETPTGYIISRQDPGSSVWAPIKKTSGTAHFDTGLQCGGLDYRYRISSYRADSAGALPEIESNVSSPITVRTAAC